LHWMDAVELSRLVREKQISPKEILAAHLEMIKSHNPHLNAVITLVDEETLKNQAEHAEKQVMDGEWSGDLHGIPLLIKDNVYTKGIRTTMGSYLYKDYVPEEDAVLVERLKNAGAIIIGKSNLPEFGLLPVTDNLLFGPTSNPFDLERTCGGSSGGSAAAVSAGMVPLATGNDVGGSIRIPASFCGVYGFKPSFGRVPSYPKMPGFETIYHEGAITRSVNDAALMLKIITGADARDRFSLPLEPLSREAVKDKPGKINVAICNDLGYISRVSAKVREALLKAARVFEDYGCPVEEISLDLPDMKPLLEMQSMVEVVTANENRLEEWKKSCYPKLYPMLEKAHNIKACEMARLQFLKDELWSKIWPLFKTYDLLVTPTTPGTAFKSGAGGPIGPGEIEGEIYKGLSWMGFTYPFNFTGLPAASIPGGYDDNGLPVGVQFVGFRYRDDLVLNASAAFERAYPWKKNQ